MRLKKTLIATIVSVLIPLGVAHAQEFSSLEERMSGNEFRAAGLERLSAEELEALNSWLRDHLGTTRAAAHVAAPPVAPIDTRGLRAEPAFGADGDIVSRIPGTFRGFSRSGQRFELENGQVWETSENARFNVDLDNPVVIISSGFMNAWYMRIEGYNTRVRVRRVR